MRSRTVIALALVVVVAAIAFTMFGRTSAMNTNAPPNGKSLLQATPEEIGEAAVEYTRRRFEVVSGEPKVLMSRLVWSKDLDQFGIGRLCMAYPDQQPLALVILKGDFDISRGRRGLIASGKPMRVGSIAYVFNLRAGIPTLTMTAPDERRFKQALDNASLPETVMHRPTEAELPPIYVAPPIDAPPDQITPLPPYDKGCVEERRAPVSQPAATAPAPSEPPAYPAPGKP